MGHAGLVSGPQCSMEINEFYAWTALYINARYPTSSTLRSWVPPSKKSATCWKPGVSVMQIVNDRQKIMEYDGISGRSGRLVFLRALFSLFVCTLMPRNPFAAPPTFGPIHQVHPKRGPSKRALLVAGMTLPKKWTCCCNTFIFLCPLGACYHSSFGSNPLSVGINSKLQWSFMHQGCPSRRSRLSFLGTGRSRRGNQKPHKLSSWLHVQFFLPS